MLQKRKKTEKPVNIFNINNEGWYEKYFSYAFTEDVYQIALKLSKKLINSAFEKEKADGLIKTFDIFYSFQESAKVINYRDHLLHQFHVFLIGFKIMSSEWWYESVAKQKDKNVKDSYAIPWTIVSLFHDIGYPFEKLELIKREYIEKLLLLDENSIPIDKVSQEILLGKLGKLNETSPAKELLELFYETINPALKELSISDKDKEKYYWFFKKQFIEERVHQVTSSLFVSHKILDGFDNKNEIISAILLHDKRVWMEMLKSSKKINLEDLGKIVKEINIENNEKIFFKYLNEKLKFNWDVTDMENLPDCRLKLNKKFYVDKNHMNDDKEVFNLKNNVESYSKEMSGCFKNNDLAAGIFVFHRIFPKNSLLNNNTSPWNHIVIPKINPMQFLLLLSDALQEGGREIGEKTFLNQYSPKIDFKNGENKALKIFIKQGSEGCDNSRLELLKIYIDLYLFKYILKDFYDINYQKNCNEIEITLKVC